MFGTIRKHQNWLWGIIITVIIVTFVIFFSPYSRMNSSQRGPANYGTINGQKVTEDDFNNAWREVELRLFFMNGRWPDDSDKKDLEAEAYRWLLLVQKQKQMGVHISSEMAAQAARGMLAQFQRSGVSSPDVFDKQVLQPHGMGLEDLERFVRHYLGIQELVATLGLSGKLVTPEEARGLYVRERQELATEAVFFSATNYLDKVSVTPRVISAFYTNQLARYRLPDRVQVSYVEFPYSNYVAQAKQELARMTNLDAQIDEAYRQGGTNFLREMKATSLEEVRAKVRDARLKELESQAARKQAAEFASPLFDMDPVRADNLEKMAKQKGLTVQVTAPFDREAGPKDLDVSQDFVTRAFNRSEQDPFAGPLLGRNAVYVFALYKKLPSEIPPLDQIRSQVTADYKEAQATAMARDAGQAFYTTLTNSLAHGQTLSAVCESAKEKLVSLPPFSISTRELPEVEEHVGMNQLKQTAFSTPVGKVSPFQMTTDGGMILYVKSRLPIDQQQMEAAMPSFIASVRQSRQGEAFNEWFSKQVQVGLRDTPVFNQPRPAPTMAPGGNARKT
ncbi:MAG TPA: peptidylprolyl isomerase [Candidatus Acidoferrum sp.]|nr:peptidylprolyl isomerase [Candidatus Acidoferrum sp.]